MGRASARRRYSRPIFRASARRPIRRPKPLEPQARDLPAPELPATLPMTFPQLAGLLLGAIASLAFIGAQFMAMFRLFIIAAFVLSAGFASAAPINPGDVHVIDGDTIRVFHKKPDVRLVGFNAPETRRAACQIEGLEGAKATRRVRDLVAAGNLDFEFVPCACPPGKELTRYCNYGRRCGTLKANGKDVGAILIAERLAVPFVCGTTSCPPTPKPWCALPTR